MSLPGIETSRWRYHERACTYHSANQKNLAGILRFVVCTYSIVVVVGLEIHWPRPLLRAPPADTPAPRAGCGLTTPMRTCQGRAGWWSCPPEVGHSPLVRFIRGPAPAAGRPAASHRPSSQQPASTVCMCCTCILIEKMCVLIEYDLLYCTMYGSTLSKLDR